MKNLMERYFWLLLIVKLNMSLTSCQHMAINSLKNNELDSNKIVYLNFNTSHALTSNQLLSVFPKQLSGLERTNTALDQVTGTATAFYGKDKYEISITDDLGNNFSNVYIFKREYRKATSNLVEDHIVKTVRDGYKTITTIQNSKMTSILFVFKHRYIFKITGTDKQTPYMVWRFLELNKFQDLPD